MASPKDKCFEAAIDAYQEFREEAGSPWKVEISHQTPWVRDPLAPSESRWTPVTHVFKEWYHIYGYAKRKFGFAKTQVRYPDVTVKMQDGSHLVLDNKFTNGKGEIDGWRTKRNEYSRTTQQKDYEDINRQQGHDIGVPSLDKDKCKCDERQKKRQLEPRTVPVPDPAYQFNQYFMPYVGPAPRTVPQFGPAPVRMPVPVLRPILIP
jgi:hypothetical protein